MRLIRGGRRRGDAECVALLRESIAAGYAPAIYALATWHLFGTGVKKDYALAARMLKTAADAGVAAAQYDLAVSYEKGMGVRRSQKNAFHYYRMAAEGGDRDGQGELARCHYFGIGTPRNFNIAFKWYRLAARRGDADAQYSLGFCFEYGDGCVLDKTAALKWYQKAAENGNRHARRAADSMERFQQLIRAIESHLAKNQYARAIVAIRKALRVAPNDHWLVTQLSSAYYEQRKYKVALATSERAFRADPSCPFVIWHHSMHLAVCGRQREAISLVRKLMARGLRSIANGPCGEGLPHTRSLLNDCRLQLADWHLELGEKSSARRYFKAHLRGRTNAKSIYGEKELKRLASQF